MNQALQYKHDTYYVAGIPGVAQPKINKLQ